MGAKVNCSGIKNNYCLAACCYLYQKRVTQEEAVELGLENIIEVGQRFYLKSKEEKGIGACVFLDEQVNQCTIQGQKPGICKIWICDYENAWAFYQLWEEVRYYRKKKGLPH